jgi:hypothetical protein
MPFEAARCPACGGSIQVPTERETANCMYCGTKIVVREAIASQRIEVSGRVTLAGVATADNDVERADQCMMAKDYPSAYQYFCAAIDKHASNYAAWEGCLLALSGESTGIDYATAPYDGVMGIPSIARNLLKYAGPDESGRAVGLVRSMLDLMEEDMDRVDVCDVEIARRTRLRLYVVIALSAGIALFIFLMAPIALLLGGVLYLFVRQYNRSLAQLESHKQSIFYGRLAQTRNCMDQLDSLVRGYVRPANR